MKGVVILALKRSNYYQAAANLAASIKFYSPNIPITLISDGITNFLRKEHFEFFTNVVVMDEADYTDKHGFSPALAKINVHKYTPYDKTLYIDADSIVLQPLEPLFELCKGDFHSEVMGVGTKADDISYQAWATNEKLWEFFDLKEDSVLRTINSTWFYFNKKSKKIFNKILKFYDKGFDLSDLKNRWGGTLPDELFFYGTLANMGIVPMIEKKACFFGDHIDTSRTLTDLQNDFFMFTLYGGRTTVRLEYREFYDRLLNKIYQSFNMPHIFKNHSIIQNKHVNNR
jgi:hypothetical protein